MAKVPQSLMGGDETFHVAATVGVGLSGFPRQHHFQNLQYMPADFQVSHVTGVVKRDKKLVLEPARIAAYWNGDLRSSLALRSANVVFIRQTRHDTS